MVRGRHFAVKPPHIALDKIHLVGGRIVHLKDKVSLLPAEKTDVNFSF